MHRVILGLTKNGDFKIPKFTECIVDYFNKESNFVHVSFTLKDNLVVLSPDKNGLKLQHSPECPIRLLSQKERRDEEDDIKLEKKALDIGVAVSVIIESSDGHVLLTRRPSHMRSSPSVWVPPGGHLEPGESLYEGGLREVKEETGLNIQSGKANFLCLWENVYPIILGFGTPTNHVLVVYFHVKMQDTHEALQKRIKFDPEEVESCCWLSAVTVTELFNNKSTESVLRQYTLENGNVVERELDPNAMFNRHLWTRRESYSGTQYALRSWLEKGGVGDGLLSKF